MKDNNSISRRVAISAISALPFLHIKNANASSQSESYSEIGNYAPKFNLPRFDGGNFGNEDLIGKTTIVEFFGLWCPDCMKDAPLVAKLAQQTKAIKGLNFLAIHTRGRYGRWGSLAAFFKEKKYSYNVAIDDDSTAYHAFNLGWVPSYIIIDKNGIIRDYTNDLGAGGIGVKGLLNRAINVRDNF